MVLVSLRTDYLSEMASLARLSEADLIVFPYQSTQESSSAAVQQDRQRSTRSSNSITNF